MTASATDQKPTLMLLDGNSLAFRAFYALPAENFKTKNGLTTNAVYGFTAMLINLLRDEQPSHIAAAFDVSRQTFRSEQVPRVQGRPIGHPRRVPRPDRHHQGGARRARHHRARRARIRGRRHHRHPGHPGRARRLPGAGGHRRPRRPATRQPRRHRALPAQGRQRADPVHPRRGGGEVRPDSAAVPGLRGAARRPQRQPARHPGGGGEDRHQVDRRVRLAAGAGRQRRRREGQGR